MFKSEFNILLFNFFISTIRWIKIYQIIIQNTFNDSSDEITDDQQGIIENQLPFEYYYCSELYFDNEIFKRHLIQCKTSRCDKANCDKERTSSTNCVENLSMWV